MQTPHGRGIVPGEVAIREVPCRGGHHDGERDTARCPAPLREKTPTLAAVS